VVGTCQPACAVSAPPTVDVFGVTLGRIVGVAEGDAGCVGDGVDIEQATNSHVHTNVHIHEI